jgi:alkanesulfonate monooxygenase SsuD/methylene tetrahydromethanopterin reductase-like flavin-dependent oxidoreductase (luciferase family)
VDVLSRGRVTLGIGTAYEHGDFHPYGYEMPSFAKRVKLLEESLQVMNSLWTQEATEFFGEFYTLEGGAAFEPKPVQKPRPTVLVGLNTAGLALKAAVRCADGINTWQLGPRQLEEMFPAVGDLCEDAGRDPASFILTSDVLCARGVGEDAAAELATRIAGVARGWGRSERVTQWDAGGVLFGDAAAMAEQAAGFASLGVSELTVALTSLEDITWFSDEVIPAVGR